MIRFLKHLICSHRFDFLCNLYGDYINGYDGKRSLWKCRSCSKIIGKPEVKYELQDNPTQDQAEHFYHLTSKDISDHWLTSKDISDHWFQMH